MNLQESVDKLATSVLEALKKRDEGTLEARFAVFSETLEEMVRQDEHERLEALVEAERQDETLTASQAVLAEQARDTAADIELERRLEAGHGIE